MKKKTFLKNTILFFIIPFLYLSFEKDIYENLAELYTDNASNLEKTFLEKFGNFGLQLFERENNQWKELILNDQNELEEKPCTN